MSHADEYARGVRDGLERLERVFPDIIQIRDNQLNAYQRGVLAALKATHRVQGSAALVIRVWHTVPVELIEEGGEQAEYARVWAKHPFLDGQTADVIYDQAEPMLRHFVWERAMRR